MSVDNTELHYHGSSSAYIRTRPLSAADPPIIAVTCMNNCGAFIDAESMLVLTVTSSQCCGSVVLYLLFFTYLLLFLLKVDKSCSLWCIAIV